MPFNEDEDNYLNNESIFQDVETNNYITAQSIKINNVDYENFKDSGLLSKLVNKISDKIDEFSDKDKKEQKKLQKIAQQFADENEDFIGLMASFGCVFVALEDCIELHCEQFNLVGKITQNEKKENILDENAKKILYIISKIVTNIEKIDNSMDKNEEDGFYPVGELEKQTIKINGEEKEVFSGTLMNEKGETKQIYFLNGREVQPD